MGDGHMHDIIEDMKKIYGTKPVNVVAVVVYYSIYNTAA
jgi:hypothetical protein